MNEKIEGFFDLCAARGLTGTQGVLIPAVNAQHLMLRADVVGACKASRFSVSTVASVDDALAALTGVVAGSRDGQGRLPADSVNGRVSRRLRELSMRQDRFNTRRRTPQAGKGRKPA